MASAQRWYWRQRSENLQNKNKKLKEELAGVKADLLEQNCRHEAEKTKLHDKLSKQIATLKEEI